MELISNELNLCLVCNNIINSLKAKQLYQANINKYDENCNYNNIYEEQYWWQFRVQTNEKFVTLTERNRNLTVNESLLQCKAIEIVKKIQLLQKVEQNKKIRRRDKIM